MTAHGDEVRRSTGAGPSFSASPALPKPHRCADSKSSYALPYPPQTARRPKNIIIANGKPPLRVNISDPVPARSILRDRKKLPYISAGRSRYIVLILMDVSPFSVMVSPKRFSEDRPFVIMRL